MTPDETRAKRLRCHAHNSLLGSVGIAKTHLRRVLNSETADGPTKELAFDLINKCATLDHYLRSFRREADGSVTHINSKGKPHD
jgi:hypothetical protein